MRFFFGSVFRLSTDIRYLLAVLLLLLVYRPPALTAQVLVPMGEAKAVMGLVEASQAVWLATEAGIFHYTEGVDLKERKAASEIADEARVFKCIAKIGNSLWVGANDGLFEVGEGPYDRVVLENFDDPEVTHIVHDEVNGCVWLGTDQGVFCGDVTRRTAKAYPVDGPISFMSLVEGELFVSNRDDTYTYVNEEGSIGKLKPLANNQKRGYVVDIVKADKYVYLQAFSGEVGRNLEGVGFNMYRYPDRLESPMVQGVFDIAAIDGYLWFSIQDTVFSHGPPGSIPQFNRHGVHIRLIGQTNEHQWLISRDGVYWRRRDGELREFEPLARKRGGFQLDTASEFSKGGVWLWGAGGAFRLYKDVRMDVQIPIGSDPFGVFRNLVIGERLRVQHVWYVRDEEAWDHLGEQGFEALLASDMRSFQSRKDRLDYDPIAEEEHLPVSPVSSIFVSVRDKYGNIQDPSSYRDVRFISKSNIVSMVLTIARNVLLIVISLFAFPLVAATWGPPSRRLQIYTLFFRYYPFGEKLASPSHRAARRLLVSILSDMRCKGPRSKALSKGHEKVLSRLQGETFNRATLVPEDKAAGVTLDSIAQEVSCCQGSEWKHVLPLPVRLDDSMSVTEEQVRAMVAVELKNSLKADKYFCSEFIEYARFLFLFSIKPGSREAVENFHRTTGRGRENMMIIEEIPRLAEELRWC